MAKGSSPSRVQIFSRTVLGIFGSYALASAAAVAIARLYPDGGRTAVTLGELIGFTLFGVAAILAFSMRSGLRAWALIGGTTLALVLVAVLAKGASA